MMFNTESFFQKLKDRLPFLKPAQARIADYIIKYPRVVINLTIKELAKETRTAPSTIVDFCKNLNFSGFRDLKIALAQELDLVESMSLNVSKISETSKDLVAFISENLDYAIKLVPQENFNKACKLILKSSVIEILAFGFDAVAGHDLFIKMKQLGFQTNFFENPFMQSLSASQICGEGCAIAISSSHSSTDLLDSMNYAKKAGASIISIAPPSSKILENSDVQLPTYPKTKVLPEGGILTRYIQLLIIDTLFLKLLEMEPERFSENYKRFECIINYKRRGDEGVV